MDGYAERRRGDYNLDIEQAWRSAHYMRVRQLPDLAREFIDIKTGKPKQSSNFTDPDIGLEQWAHTLMGKKNG